MGKMKKSVYLYVLSALCFGDKSYVFVGVSINPESTATRMKLKYGAPFQLRSKYLVLNREHGFLIENDVSAHFQKKFAGVLILETPENVCSFIEKKYGVAASCL